MNAEDQIHNLIGSISSQFKRSAPETPFTHLSQKAHGASASESQGAHESAESQAEDTQNAVLLFYKQLALSDLVPGLCHDMNNPLAIIAGTSQQLHKLVSDAKIEPEKATSLFERLDRNSERLSNLVRGLAFLSRNPFADQMRQVEAKKLMEEVIPFSDAQFKKHGIALTSSVPEGGLKIFCRPTLLAQSLVVMLSQVRLSLQALKSTIPRWTEIKWEQTSGFSTMKVQYSASFETEHCDWPLSSGMAFLGAAVRAQKGTFTSAPLTDKRDQVQIRQIEISLHSEGHNNMDSHPKL